MVSAPEKRAEPAPPHGASRLGRGSATALPGSRDVYFGLEPPLDLCKAGAVGNRFSRGGPLQYFHAGPHLLRRGILSLTPDGQHAFGGSADLPRRCSAEPCVSGWPSNARCPLPLADSKEGRNSRSHAGNL